MKKERSKKILGLLIVTILFFSKINNVYASILTINSISNEFANTSIIQEFNTLNAGITSKVDSINQKLDIYAGNEKVFSFDYGDDYIEYNNRSTAVTKENCEKGFLDVIYIYGVIESVLRLSGYENKTISDYNVSYETYGIQLETESYDFSWTSESGGTVNMSGDYIKYFKISLDTDKIATLIDKYGVDIEEDEIDKEINANLVPILEAKDITENSVTIFSEIPDYDSEDDLICYIYRSTSENGTYEIISDWGVNCLGSVGIVDEGLKSNTTYYYKAIIEGGDKYSDIIKVTTKSSLEVNENIEEDPTIPENPQTGSFISMSFLSITIILIAGIIYFVKKKNSIYKI